MMVFNRNLLFQGSFSGSMLVFGGVSMLDFWAVLFWGSYLLYFFQEPPDPENKETEARWCVLRHQRPTRGRTMNKQKDLSCN